MFGSHHLERVRRTFADQFAIEGADLVYRKNLKGEPIPVSEAERDRFVRDFERSLRRLFWGYLIGTFVLTTGLAIGAATMNVELGAPAIYATVLAPMAVAAPFWMRAWNAPANQVGDRNPIGGRLSGEELQRKMYARMSWGQLLGGAAAGGAFFVVISTRYDVTHGWARLWLVAAGAFLALIVRQAFRKWQATQEKAP